MLRLRGKTSSLIAAAIMTIGSAVGVSVATAPAAKAVACIDGGPGPIWNGSNDYLDDYGGGSGTYVHTYQYTGSLNQTWCLESFGGGVVIHPLNNEDLCLDAHTDNNGQQVWVWTCNYTKPQIWKYTPNFTNNFNAYIVRSTNSGVALRDTGHWNIVAVYNSGNNPWQW